MPEATVPERVVVRREAAEDHPAIRRVVADAFGSTTEADLVEAIRASDEYIGHLALVAQLDDENVGHVMISGARLCNGRESRPIVMLSPLAVAPAHQRCGIGSMLVREVTRLADQRGEPLVVLEGSPAYYQRFGFVHALRYGIKIDLPDWAPPEAAQVLPLSSYDLSLTGQVTYPAAFDGLA